MNNTKINKKLMEIESMFADISNDMNTGSNEKKICEYLDVILAKTSEVYDLTIDRKRTCNICKSQIRAYLPFGVTILRSNAQCPVCGSLERHRALWMDLEKNECLTDRNRELKVLHFAPEKIFMTYFGKHKNIDYYPVDFDPNYPGIRDRVDITDIPYKSGIFDIIICNHVLEHIPDDNKALSELKRVLSDDGIAYINVPISNQEKTLENPDYNTPDLRLKHYGQDDHVRLYGNDYVDRLRSSGFKVTVVSFKEILSEEDMRKYGFDKNEKIFRCRK
jgi:predicted SAM-dependent methyltransferase